MGNEISQFVDHDQSIRRTPQTVVDNEHRYDFVATWSTANVHALLRAYTKRATPDGTLGQDKSQRLEDIYQDIVRLETLVESMRLEDAAADVIDTNMTDTPIPHSHVEIGTDVCPAHTLHDIKDTMTPSTPSSQPSTKPLKLKTKPTPKTPEQLQEAFLNSTEAEYVARRHDILLELEAKRRAYRTLAQLPTSLDGIDFSLPVQWSHYFQSVMEVDADAHAGAADNARRLWHPASIGHIMERDPDAPGQLRAFALATAAAAASSANAHAGGDGHTENENASVSDDEDLNSDNEDDKTAAKADGDDAAVETTATTPPEANVVEPRGVLTKRSLDQHTLETAVAAVPLPPLFDPSLRSPVFFGYSVPPPGGPTPSTGPTGSSILPGTHHHDDDDDKVRAAQYFESRLQEIAHRFHDANAIETGKLNALSDRRHAQLERRQKDAAVRQRELDDARKEGVDPTADFFRTAEVTQRQVDIQERAEDDLYESHKNSITSRMHAARVTCDQDTQFLQSLQSPDKPMGAARAAFHTEQLRLHHQSLLSAKNDLVSSTVLDQTKSRSLLQLTSDGAKQQTARGQLLFAEDQVKAAEHTIAVLLSQIDDEEFMLDRGETQIAQEITYFPSFQVFSQDGDTLLDVAFALVVMCAAPLSEKLEYVSQLSETNLLTKPALVQILTVFFRILNRMDQLRTPKDRQTWPVLDQFHLANLVDHMMVGSGGFKSYVTTFEFVSITTDAIQRSKYLSTILRVPWKYQHVSRVQQQAMSALRQFECGLISASDLKYRLARQSIQSAPRGGSSAKEALHVRALAMGSNDPLKADYSKYLKHRRRKVLSNVVPLDHACYKNLIVYRSEVAEKAAIRLQTTWRARQGRVDATMAARKQAFYHAKGTALADARASVEADWRRQEGTTTTLDKMKFDAKIRMRQVKLRTKGLAFSRDDVLRVMTEEAVQDTLEEVDHRFREMEEAAGYCPRVLRFDPLDDAHFSEIAHSLVDQLQRARRPPPATAKLMRAIAEKEIKKEVPETSATWCEPTDKTAVERFHEAVKDLKVQREASHDHMLRGIEPVQATSSERREWMTLMCSNPPLTEWCARLVAICDGMTQLKLTELLMELPSKRHAIAYVRGFHNDIMGAVDRDALVADLMGHFRVLRGVEPLADALIHMATTDMETTWRDDILYHMNAQEAFLVDYVHKSHIKHAGQAARDARQRGRGNTDAKLNMDTQRSMAVDAKARLDDAMVKWKDAEFSYAQAQRRMQLVRDSAVTLVDRRDRMLWAERLKRALETTDKGAHTYIEVVHVCQDFVEVARHVATQIVREYYLPVHEKTVMPVAGPFLMDGRNDGAVRSSHGKGLKFEAHNIRFQVALDDHGRFDHSDELAAKFAGAECRNSSLFLPTMLLTPNVLVPLQCCVDYHGMRVLCVSKLPIECYDVSDKGVVQNVRTEFVYGTNNKGKTIVSHSKTLDASIAKVNASLNLGAHCVRGSLDLTAKLIHGAGDMHGYIGQDETFCLLKFRRMMPPEDPEETPHLPASTRGMSILWRQLRPALVKTHPMPLSPDALSLLTYQTPDWENQAARVKDCTRRMLDDVLPLFARKLAEREISEHAQDVVSDKVVTVDRKYTGDSCQNVPLYKGDIQSKHDLRRLILVEMLQRTIKNLVRASLRSMLQARQLAMGPTTQTSLFVVVLNYISGSGAGSDAFWKNQVFDGVRARFGSIAVSFVDRLNLRQAPVEIARYLSTAIGFELTRDCWTRFTQHPHGFLFTIDDIHVDVPCRIRHNLLVLHFAAASMLLDQASTVQRTTYPAAILFDAPCGYWPLNERKGSIVAKNMVSSTDHGKFSPHCTLEAAGPIANDDLGRSVEFSKDGYHDMVLVVVFVPCIDL
ncbi:hypothetical protein DYB36_000855 [Aphanomyces astaci]|uniref:Clu domain-containing protein n=1 Tax=Aphanomyces astaci TaxID=112090 RepID=A0A397AIY7_APHAT|nr:hypothetical protein DYB36_000855 [Aphanomyces astaci]